MVVERKTGQKRCQAVYKLAGMEPGITLPHWGCSFHCPQGDWLGWGTTSRRAAPQKLSLMHLLTHLHSWGCFPLAKSLLLLSFFLGSVLLLSPITGWTLLFVGDTVVCRGHCSGQVRASTTGSRGQGTRGCVYSGRRCISFVRQPSHSTPLRTGLTQDPGIPTHFKLIVPSKLLPSF